MGWASCAKIHVRCRSHCHRTARACITYSVPTWFHVTPPSPAFSLPPSHTPRHALNQSTLSRCYSACSRTVETMSHAADDSSANCNPISLAKITEFEQFGSKCEIYTRTQHTVTSRNTIFFINLTKGTNNCRGTTNGLKITVKMCSTLLWLITGKFLKKFPGESKTKIMGGNLPKWGISVGFFRQTSLSILLQKGALVPTKFEEV